MAMHDEVILLVEDSAEHAELARAALREAGCDAALVVARDGEEALEYLTCTGRYRGQDRRILPLIVLLDLGLPKISGMEVLRRIRTERRLQSLLVVVLTSSEAPQDRIQADGYGVNLYLQKPETWEKYLQVAGTIKSVAESLVKT